jgi:hypothetical protein
MATQQTTNVELDYPEPGDSSWHTPLNSAIAAIDLLFAQALTKDVAGSADVTLTLDEVKGPALELTGALAGNIEVVLPRSGQWIIRNNTSGSFSVTVVRVAASTGVVVAQGRMECVTADSTVARGLADNLNDVNITGGTIAGLSSLGVSGNISVTGTVDGRDLGVDGSKLDGIESGATADQTGAEIKAAYEGEADTNAFTDALLSKLNGIEAAATADQTGAEIKALYEAEADTNALTDERAARVDQLPDVDGFAASLASILSFTPTGTSYFDQRAYKDIIRKGEPGRSYYSEAASATRGSRKEMPLQGIVAWSADTVAIIDTEFGEPTLWMVFQPTVSPTGDLNVWRTSRVISDAQVVAGVLVASIETASVGGVIVADFVKDDYGRYHETVSPFGLIISQRNDATDGVDVGVTIVEQAVNSVAISPPLGHYPLDQYGRPAFAIACATAGGVSVILPDADNRGKRVTDSATTTLINRVQWDGDRLYFSRADFGRFATVALSEIEAGDSWGSVSLTGANDFTTSSTPALPDNTQNRPTVIDRDLLAFRGVGTVETAMGFVAPNRVNRDGSMVALLTSTSLSGWMPGDCKLAPNFNAYPAGSVAAATPLDDDFSVDTTANWTALDEQTFTISGGTLTLQNDGAKYAKAYQELTLTVGDTYTIEVELQSISAGFGRVYIATSAPQVGDLASSGIISESSPGSYTYTFTATATATYLVISQRNDADAISEWGPVTVKRAYPDLSPGDNGAIINGTLTAAAVETGADLFALSGWSLSDYLEVPYSSDFDFGTDDFAAFVWASDVTTSDSVMAFQDGVGSGFGTNANWEILESSGVVQVRISDGSNSALASTGRAVSDNAMIGLVKRGNTLEAWIDGSLGGTADASSVGSMTNSGSPILLGVTYFNGTLSQPLVSGSIALPRVTKGYAPTPEQIRRMYEDEKKLFEPGAKCFLPSDTVNDIDARDDLLAIGTESGAVIHDGFKRLELLDSGDIGLTENGVDSVALLGGNDIAAVTGTEGVARLAARNLAEAQVVDAYSYERDFAGKGYTTDATPLDIAKLPLAEGELIEWRGSITARSDDGTERASYTRVVRAYRDVNGNATLAGADALGTDDETTAGMDVAFAADTTAQTIDLQVTGVASTNIQWSYSGTLTVNKQ